MSYKGARSLKSVFAMIHHSSFPVIKVIITAVLVVVFAAGTLVAKRKGCFGMGGNTVVRCRNGHLFTTIWVRGVSLKSLRLGGARFQYCSIGKHWSLVTPVKESELSEEQRRTAHGRRDIRVP